MPNKASRPNSLNSRLIIIYLECKQTKSKASTPNEYWRIEHHDPMGDIERLGIDALTFYYKSATLFVFPTRENYLGIVILGHFTPGCL